MTTAAQSISPTTRTRTTDLTILIVNWNAGDALRDCLQSIRRCPSRYPVQVIVVDNASSDGSAEMARRDFPEFQVIDSGGNLGFGRANNLARSRVATDLVLFLNPDSVLQPGALDAMVAAMDRMPEVGAAGCKMRYADGRVWEQLTQRFPSPWTEFMGTVFVSGRSRRFWKNLFPHLDPNRSSNVSKLCGGCFMARKSVLDAVGWFDERYFMYAEDVDLSRSIQDGGWKLYYVSEGEISHVGGASSGKTESAFPTLMRCESMAKLMRKYYGAAGAANYRVATFAGALIRLAMLTGFRVLRLCVPALRSHDVSGAARKCRLMLQWSLGLKRPTIPDQHV